ncbi:MAG: CHAT domain-containing protein [Lewinellaceae bacterium]|nr:CHAT domain-containing protein [Lewinellaceae bacterium]
MMNRSANPFLKLPVYWLALLLAAACCPGRLPGQAMPGEAALPELGPGQALLDAGQAEAALEWAEAFATQAPAGRSVPIQAALLTLQGNAWQYLGDLGQAMELHQQALEMREAHFGSASLEVSNSCQNIGNCWLAQGQAELALVYLKRARKIRESKLAPPHDALASIYNSLAEAWRQQGNYPEAEKLLGTAIRYREALHGDRHASVAPLLLSLSNVHLDQGRPAAAGQALERLLRELQGVPARERAPASNNMGYCQLALGAPEQALRYHEQAVALLENQTENSPILAQCLAGLGQCYLSLGEPSEAEPLLRQAIAIYRSHPRENLFKVAETYNDLGLCYRSRGQLPQAIGFHEQAISLYTEGGRAGHPNLAGFYSNLGKCLTEQGSYAHARYFFQKALDMPGSGLSYRQNKMRLLLLIGNTFLAEQNPGQALGFFERARRECQRFAFRDSAFLQLVHYCIGNAFALSGQAKPAASQYDKALAIIEEKNGKGPPGSNFYDYEKAQVLAAKGHVLQKAGLALREQNMLYQALSAYREAAALVKGIQPHFRNESSGLYLQSGFSSLYHGLIELCHYLSEGEGAFLAQAFRYSEDYKSAQLRRSLWRNRTKSYAGLPDSLVALEKQLKQQFYFYRQQCKQEEEKGPLADPQTLRQYYARLEEADKQQENLKTYLSGAYPAYAGLLYRDSLITLPALQEMLSPQQVLLEYTITDTLFFLFVATQDTSFMLRRQWPEPLAREAENYYYLARTRPDVQPNRSLAAERFAASAYELYRQLLQPVAPHLREELIIIPDGILCYLPFDALLQQPGAPAHLYADHAYLARDFAVGYCYSATLLHLMSSRRLRQPRNQVLAVAPSFENDPVGLRPLEYNTQEAHSVASLWSGASWQGEEASKANFASHAGQFRFLHLATHCALQSGQLDDSFLAFTAGPDSSAGSSLLYLPEVFGLSLQAEMVTLSACQTGIGVHHQGEGLASMARAFAYAGAKCVVASLWSIDDKQTSELMRLFYKNMSEGYSKPQALRLARLQYLEKSGHELGHPYYWAAMVSIGDPASIEDVPAYSLAQLAGWKLFLGLALFFGVLAIFYKIRIVRVEKSVGNAL